jgi:hypothetical protein
MVFKIFNSAESGSLWMGAIGRVFFSADCVMSHH